MNGRVTLADIARRAGVHVTTVSLALRNHPSLPITTRERLRALADEMGYTPDPALRALVAYRTRNVIREKHQSLAYVTHWNTRWGWKTAPAHAEFHQGVLNKSRQLGYQLDHFWAGEPGMTHQRLSDILYARGITGLIIASHRREVDVELAFDWPRFTAVKIDYFPHRPNLHNVTNNQSAIVRMAVRNTLEAGYRRVGLVMHRGWDHSVDQAWTAGFLCEQQRIAPKSRIPMCLFPEPEPATEWMCEGTPDGPIARGMFEVPVELFKQWYDQYRPEVIISKATFVRRALQELGLQVPGDVALVDLFLENTDGTVAGVRQNHHVVGELAVEILVGQLQQGKRGIPDVPTITYVEGTWFDGASLPAFAGRTARLGLGR